LAPLGGAQWLHKSTHRAFHWLKYTSADEITTNQHVIECIP